jgi:hypothetical protein
MRLQLPGKPQTASKPANSPRLPVPAQNSNYLENGRWYHGYRKGIYMYPCDEVGRRRPTAPSGQR